MQTNLGVFNTDEVNRYNMRIATEALASSVEKRLLSSIKARIPLGLPMLISHDWHRPLGWTTIAGVYLEGKKSYQGGYVQIAETESERRIVEELHRAFLASALKEQAAPFEVELRSRVGNATSEVAALTFAASAALKGSGIAQRLFPKFFEPSSTIVDKDGLVDYGNFLNEVEVVHPGIYRSLSTDALLYAHPFFRRSLSRSNNLNEHFLREFHEYAIT